MTGTKIAFIKYLKFRGLAMDSNLLTISNILIQAGTGNPVASKFGMEDLKKGNSKFSIDQDQELVNLKENKSGTADNICEIGLLETNKKLVESTEQGDNIGNLDSLLKEKTGTKSEKKGFSQENEDESVNNQEVKITIGSLVREIARNNEPGGGRQLSELIRSFEENRILPVTANAAKSIENKQLLLTDSRQIGIKTVLPEKSNGCIALRDDLPAGPVKALSNNSPEQIPNISNVYSIDTKTTTTADNGNNIKLKPEVFVEKGSEKAVELQPQADQKQINTLNVERGITEDVIGNANKVPLTNVDASLSQTRSSQSIDKAVEFRRNVTVKDIEKFVPTEKQTSCDEKDVGPRRIKEFSNIKEILQQVKGSNNGSNGEKWNILDSQITGRQTGTQSRSTSDDGVNSKTAQFISHNSAKAVAVEQPVSTNENNVRIHNFTNQGPSNEVPFNIGKQILESIHSTLSQQGPDKKISVRLNPPELGEVFIKFQEKDSQITGLLEVNKTQTRSEIEQILPQIIRNLSDSGVNVKRLEVVLTNEEQTEHGTFKDASMFNNQHQHDFNDSGLYDGQQDISRIHEWLANTVNFENPALSEVQGNAGLQDELTMNDSINILI